MARYSKFIAALAAALAVTGTAVADGKVTLTEGIAIASAFIGALVVRQVTNEPMEPKP